MAKKIHGTRRPDGRKPADRLSGIITGYWMAQAVYVAARLGIADRLREGAHDAESLADAVGADRGCLQRLMRALVAAGIFDEAPDGRYALSEAGALLCDDAEGSLRATAIMMGDEHYQAWGQLLHSVRTGETAFDHVYGMGVFDYHKRHEETTRVFDRAMTEVNRRSHQAAVEAYDFSRFKRLVDVGGGRGTLLAEILVANKGLAGVLFEQPEVAEDARAYLADRRLTARCEVATGDFFESIVAGADGYLMSHVIHDWCDERANVILRNVRRAIAPDGTLLLHERVIGAKDDGGAAALADLNMMVMTGGLERSEDQFARLLESAGFELVRVIDTPAANSLVEARPA